MHFESKLIHGGYEKDPHTGATRVPIYQTAAFAYDSAEELEDVFNGRRFGHYYSRVSNPTVAALESRIALLEDGRSAIATASGMSALTTIIFALAQAGDNIVVSSSIFGSTFYLLNSVISQSGIEIRYVLPTDLDGMEKKIDDRTQLIFAEVLGNPKLDIPDFAAISAMAGRHRIPFVLDNTFMTPYLFSAKAFGVAVTMHATTKYLCGGGTAIGGVIDDLGTFDWKSSRSTVLEDMTRQFGDVGFIAMLRKVRSNMGSCLSPQNAFLSMLGLETLHLRMDRHCENAMKVASFLSGHPKVADVTYPGLPSHPGHALATAQFLGRYGGMLSIRLGSKANAYAFINSVKMAKNLVNLGDAKTLVVAPRHTIYRNFSNEEADRAGVYDDLVRISIGLEHGDDIISDFSRALEAVN